MVFCKSFFPFWSEKNIDVSFLRLNLILMTVMLLLGIPIGTDTRSIRLAKVRAWLTAIGAEALPLAFLTTRGYFNNVYFLL